MSEKEVGLIAGIIAVAGLVSLFIFKKEEIKDIVGLPVERDYVRIPYSDSIEEYRDKLGDTINKTLDDSVEVFTDTISSTKEELVNLVTNAAGQTPMEEYREALGDTITKVQDTVKEIVVEPIEVIKEVIANTVGVKPQFTVR